MLYYYTFYEVGSYPTHQHLNYLGSNKENLTSIHLALSPTKKSAEHLYPAQKNTFLQLRPSSTRTQKPSLQLLTTEDQFRLMRPGVKLLIHKYRNKSASIRIYTSFYNCVITTWKLRGHLPK